MNLNRVKTNNSFLFIKQEFRKEYIKNLKCKNVLDAYCGESEIWKIIKTDSYLGIDENLTNDINLKGDNRKYLGILDLSKFNIIDLDAYGIPFNQLKLIFENKTLKQGTIVFFTFIQSFFGIMPHSLLQLYGYRKKMIKKIPTLFFRKGFKIFKWYLATRGIKKIEYIKVKNKIYGMFEVDKKEKIE